MGKSRRHNKVVPQREFVIKADSRGDFLFKGFSYCAFRFIDLVRNIGHDLETCFCDSVGGAPACIANREQRGAAPTAGDLGEEPVFDGVELGTIGRVVNHEDFDVEFFGEVEEVLLDNPVPAGVGAAAVAEDGEGVGVGILPLEIFAPHFFEMVAEEFGCVVACRDGHISGVVPDVVDAVGCYGGLGKSSEVMVKGLGLPVAKHLPVTLEVANGLFLLRVHADNWDSRVDTPANKTVNLPELGIPFRDLSHGYALGKRPLVQPRIPNHLLHNVACHFVPALPKLPDYLRGVDVKPCHAFVLWETCLMSLHNLVECLLPLRVLGKFALGTASWTAYPPLSWGKTCQYFKNSFIHSVFAPSEKGDYGLDSGSGASHRERREIMPPLELIERVKVCYFHLCEFNWGFFHNLCNVLEINYKDTKLFPVICCI